jgi:hypothetical protein
MLTDELEILITLRMDWKAIPPAYLANRPEILRVE